VCCGGDCTGAHEAYCHDGQDDDCDGFADCADPDCRDRDAEVCNGVDDDCNGLTDEGYNVGLKCAAGTGICARVGTIECKPGGTSGCSVSAGQSETEKCNALDDNCNGATDEGFGVGSACTVGVGGCRRTGTTICKPDGTAGCSASPGASETEKCNSLDDNCNGTTDEGFNVGAACAVGVGGCRRTGTMRCNAAQSGTECSVVAGSPQREVCNGQDDDCDGSADEAPSCGGPSWDVAENSTANWTWADSADDNPVYCNPTTRRLITAYNGNYYTNVKAGVDALRLDYGPNGAAYFQAVYPVARNGDWDLSTRTGLHFWVRSDWPLSYGGFSPPGPLVVLCGPSGYRVLSPTWEHIAAVYGEQHVPLAGVPGVWNVADYGTFSLARVDSVELHQNAWQNGGTGTVYVFYDDVRFY